MNSLIIRSVEGPKQNGLEFILLCLNHLLHLLKQITSVIKNNALMGNGYTIGEVVSRRGLHELGAQKCLFINEFTPSFEAAKLATVCFPKLEETHRESAKQKFSSVPGCTNDEQLQA